MRHALPGPVTGGAHVRRRTADDEWLREEELVHCRPRQGGVVRRRGPPSPCGPPTRCCWATVRERWRPGGPAESGPGLRGPVQPLYAALRQARSVVTTDLSSTKSKGWSAPRLSAGRYSRPPQSHGPGRLAAGSCCAPGQRASLTRRDRALKLLVAGRP